MRKILVTGGLGYVGCVLVNELLNKGYRVNVIDLGIYGNNINKNQKLNIFLGDIRNQKLFKESVNGCDTVIHLACISNDPSFDLNPDLGKSINLDAFRPMVEISKKEVFENQQNPKSNRLSKPGFSYSDDFVNVSPHIGYDSPKMQKDKAALKEK